MVIASLIKERYYGQMAIAFLTKPLSCPKREVVTALSAEFSTSPSLLQGELHILTKPQ